jgi:hypothetical protein
VVVFLLASTSIGALLIEFAVRGSMPLATTAVFLPAMAVLALTAWLDHRRGTGLLYRYVLIGASAGLLAAVSYDLFRIPFVFARPLHLAGLIPALPLFKVFALFGTAILHQPDTRPTLASNLVGWAYHFSNGLTFGIMYVALLGQPERRHWAWGILFAVGLELAMIYTPYPTRFGMNVGAALVTVTRRARLIFGLVMGLCVRAWSRQWSARHRAATSAITSAT